MSWFTDFFWPAAALSDIRAELAAIRMIADSHTITSADADKAAAVADALTADDAADTVAIDAADAIVANLVNPPAA